MNTNYLTHLFGLEDRTVVVIGGTGVLGGALCRGVAKAGARIVVAGRNKKSGVACADAIIADGGQAAFIPCDATRRESIVQLAADVEKRFGDVFGLVNCVGVNAATPYFEITDASWDQVLAANLRATHQACQVFGRSMVGRKEGAILNIGSVTSERPLSRVFAYSCSKAAVQSLSRNLGREFAPSGVRVNCLCPGFFPAEQNRAILDEERTSAIMRHTPMARFGEPEELVGAALLLLSPVAGKFITSESLFVDGGFSAMTI